MSTRRSSRRGTSNIPAADLASDQGRNFSGVIGARQITPRNSIAGEIIADTAKETPYDTLRQLASIIPRPPTTPLRRASSAGPPSTYRSDHRTPAGIDRTPGGGPHPGSTRRAYVPTPHAKAAFRENEIRRAAALTPGKGRRRSGRQQRETPRDILRALSRVLAPITKPIETTPRQGSLVETNHRRGRENDEFDDGPQPPRPSLSMPDAEDDDDDSFLLPPRRISVFADDDSLTQQSVELPRRALSEQPKANFLRGSFGSIRTSERFGEINEVGLDLVNAQLEDSSLIEQGNFADDGSLLGEEDSTFPRDAGRDITRSDLDYDTERSFSTYGRTSDIRPLGLLQDETETTFVLPLPQLGSSPGRHGMNNRNRIQQGENDNSQDNEQLDTIHPPRLQKEQLNENKDTTIGAAMQDRSTRVVYGRRKGRRIKMAAKLSKHGIQYSSLPAGVVKKMATTFLRTSGNSKAKISKDTLEFIVQATDWFLEQASDDLGIYAEHAGRKTIDENDVITLMRRQRQTIPSATPFALAQRYLPRELLQDLRMPPLRNVKRSRKLELIGEEVEKE